MPLNHLLIPFSSWDFSKLKYQILNMKTAFFIFLARNSPWLISAECNKWDAGSSPVICFCITETWGYKLCSIITLILISYCLQFSFKTYNELFFAISESFIGWERKNSLVIKFFNSRKKKKKTVQKDNFLNLLFKFLQWLRNIESN